MLHKNFILCLKKSQISCRATPQLTQGKNCSLLKRYSQKKQEDCSLVGVAGVGLDLSTNPFWISHSSHDVTNHIN